MFVWNTSVQRLITISILIFQQCSFPLIILHFVVICPHYHQYCTPSTTDTRTHKRCCVGTPVCCWPPEGLWYTLGFNLHTGLLCLWSANLRHLPFLLTTWTHIHGQPVVRPARSQLACVQTYTYAHTKYRDTHHLLLGQCWKHL